MKLSGLKARVLTAATAAELETQLTDFLRGSGEATFVQVEFAIAVGVYSVTILYAS